LLNSEAFEQMIANTLATCPMRICAYWPPTGVQSPLRQPVLFGDDL